MGKRSNRQKNTNVFDSDDDTVSTSSTSMSDASQVQENEEVYGGGHRLDNYLDALYEKRGSVREKALEGLVSDFASQVQSQFAESNCITLQHQFINSIKRGSASEASLASRALGLLALTVGSGDSAHEILEESLVNLAQVLKSGSDSRKQSSVLDCLAVLTFVGGNESEETQKSMQLIWQLIHPKPRANVGVASKPTPSVVAAAVSAWSFLLTTVDGWRMSSSDWQESASYLSTLLDKDDRAIRLAAGEAIALIFEISSFEKGLRGNNGDSVVEGKNSQGIFSYVEALKDKILNQVRSLSMEAGGKGSAKKDLNNQRSLFRDVLEFLEYGHCPETSIKMQHGDPLVVSTWSQLIQLNFMKHFLGSGFAKHMQENELLHDVFNFTPKKKQLGGHGHLAASEKRMFKSPNSAVNKARTQLLNKQRMLAQDRNAGHYNAVLSEDM
ncbi:hypothetical protein H6P81_020601 [Aristolochia fimbriata]|uniref:Interferon-related developmental regulator 1 n=1 Tax=Aristolochia fimbriata TaxID=158543 RepID=A0AAV7DW15_ARIFI|nr:hypothetical protein H6P81_020601 [Aristolochia fimbriata]